MIIAIMGKCTNEHNQFIGVKQAGKDTVRDIIKNNTTQHKVQYLNFADKLKETITNIYQSQVPDIYQRLNTQELKETPIPELNNKTPRWLAEYFGTELMNSSKLLKGIWIKYYLYEILKQLLPSPLEQFIVDMIGPANFNLDTLHHELINMQNALKHFDFPETPKSKLYLPTLFITSDLRFPAEYIALNTLKQLNICKVLVVQVTRTLPGQIPSPNIHPSNQSYPEMVPDIIIENNSSIEHLTLQIQKQIKT